MAGKTFTYELLILERHLDTFGHVNNAVYLQLFEEARWDYITRAGYGMAEIKEHGLGPVILEVHLRFRKELMLREQITIESQCIEYKRLTGKIAQRIINGRGECAADAVFTFGLFDTTARRLVAPTERWLQAVGWGQSEV